MLAPNAVQPVAAGSGYLPPAVKGSVLPPLSPVTLRLGDARSIWILFERARWSPGSRLTLRLATAGGEPIRVTILDAPLPRPHWTYEPVTPVGLWTRIETNLFGTDGYGGAVGVGAWVARSSVRLDLGYWFGLDTHAAALTRSPARLRSASAPLSLGIRGRRSRGFLPLAL